LSVRVRGGKVPLMAIELNHTIVHAVDPELSATFLTEILGLPPPRRLYHFWIVQTANGASLDYLTAEPGFDVQHLAFLVSESEFDTIFGRLKQRGLTYWADPAAKREGEINCNDGGRGVYFKDPSQHYLEILTRPYGSGG
jgi:catechol 2,3-dioxygenase-like lactoylglutathione lyase family enzyme